MHPNGKTPPADENDYDILYCTRETFQSCDSDCVRWWEESEWEQYYRASKSLWEWPFSADEWKKLYGEGLRYCSAIVGGQAVSTAGLLKVSDTEWEVIAVGTSPTFRRKGYGKSVVSFVTEFILDEGRTAIVGFVPGNLPMRRTAETLGYRE